MMGQLKDEGAGWRDKIPRQRIQNSESHFVVKAHRFRITSISYNFQETPSPTVQFMSYQWIDIKQVIRNV